MSFEVNFTAAARLIYQLGEQLIPNEIVALLELIKNGYDADATKVSVIIDTEFESIHGKGLVEITDTGNGMLPSIIEDAFLQLSTNFKEVEKISPYFRRRVVGSKGVGRLSVQKLGNYLEVITQPRVSRFDDKFLAENRNVTFVNNGYNEAKISIDWAQFKNSIRFDDVQASVQYQNTDVKKLGTTLRIYGIRNPQVWKLTGHDTNRIRNEILRMTNVFNVHKRDKFRVDMDIDGKKFKNVEIDEDLLRDSAHVTVDFKFNNWILDVNINRKESYFNSIIDKEIKKREGKNYELLSINEECISELSSKSYRFDFLSSEFVKDHPRFANIKFEEVDELETDNNEIFYAYPGSFEGSIYAIDRSSSSKGYWTDQISEGALKKYNIKIMKDLYNSWDHAKGVYMFRDQFRILPYGEDEWLGFNDYNQRVNDVIFRGHNISGYITIDGESSESILEQTNRLGLVENEHGKNFFAVVKGVLAEQLCRDDDSFREGFEKNVVNNELLVSENNILVFQRAMSKVTKNEVAQDLENIIDKKILDSNLILDQPTEVLVEIKEKVKEYRKVESTIETQYIQQVYEKELELEEIRDVYPLVGQGMVLETLTHELSRVESNIKSYASSSIKELKKKEADTNYVVDRQNHIIDQTFILKNHLEHFEPTYSKDYKNVEEFDIADFLIRTYSKEGPIKNILDQNSIELSISGYSDILANKGLLITVFDNLFLNSVYWLNLNNDDEKKIIIKVEENGKVRFTDNGPGIHPEIENTLFEPFKSYKVNGRGLGLYICKEILALNEGTIRLSRYRYKKDDRIRSFIMNFKVGD